METKEQAGRFWEEVLEKLKAEIGYKTISVFQKLKFYNKTCCDMAIYLWTNVDGRKKAISERKSKTHLQLITSHSLF